jgi:RNA polymerase sigma-70 factor (ECF subfamily)
LDELPEPAVQRRELAHHLEAALESLPFPERQMVVMRAIHGLNYAEIAAATERPVGTVKSKLSRARAKLRGLLGAIDSAVA